MSYIPDNLDAYDAHERDQDRKREMAEYSLPKCLVCEETVYPGEGVYIPKAWEYVHKGECLKAFVEEEGADEDDVYLYYVLNKMEGVEE